MELGAVRLKLTLTEERVLPRDDYVELERLLWDPEVLQVLNVGLKAKEEMARIVLRIAAASGQGVDLLRQLTKAEIDSTGALSMCRCLRLLTDRHVGCSHARR